LLRHNDDTVGLPGRRPRCVCPLADHLSWRGRTARDWQPV